MKRSSNKATNLANIRDQYKSGSFKSQQVAVSNRGQGNRDPEASSAVKGAALSKVLLKCYWLMTKVSYLSSSHWQVFIISSCSTNSKRLNVLSKRFRQHALQPLQRQPAKIVPHSDSREHHGWMQPTLRDRLGEELPGRPRKDKSLPCLQRHLAPH